MEVDRKWCLVSGIGEVEKVFGSGPGEWAGKEPPRIPHGENVETQGNGSTTGLLLNCSHLLIAAVPADKYLDRVLRNCRGGSGGLGLTHLWKKSYCGSPLWHQTHTHTSCDSRRVVFAEFSLAQSLWLRGAQRKMGAHWRVLRSRGIGWKRGKPRRALRPGLSWDSTSRLLRLTLTLLSQLLLLIIDISIYMVKRIFWDCPPPSKSKTAFWRKSLKAKYYSACRHPLDDTAENCQWQLWTSLEPVNDILNKEWVNTENCWRFRFNHLKFS